MTALLFHEFAELFPLMNDDEYSSLIADIHTNGLRQPIMLFEGKVLDGRNRFKACQEANRELKCDDFLGTSDEALAYVLSLNLQRRHLNAGQKAVIALDIERIEAERARKRQEATRAKPGQQIGGGNISTTLSEPGKARDKAAAAVGVNSRYVSEAKRINEESPELIEKVRNGKITIAEAIRENKTTKAVAKIKEIAAKESTTITGIYDVIVIDPPWPMQKINRDVRPNQVGFDYPTMTEGELMEMEIPASEHCHVWLWTTHKFLPMAMRLLEAWNLKYVCTFVWHKPGGFQPLGLPQYNCEFALYARRGSPFFIETKAFPACFNAPRGAHSEKPEQFYEVLRRVTTGRRLDMFNRRLIDGFDTWGKEAA